MFNKNIEFKVHFIGISGVSMSWLAEYFKTIGFCVSGSDKNPSDKVDRLRSKGITVFVGHNENNMEGAHVVIYSDAISEDNIELVKARQSGVYVLSRGEALKSVAENFGDVVGVCGCHGKTTTTCMLAHIFNSAGLKFSAHIGGEDSVLGNFIMRGNDVFLSEVCEFKRNIDKFTADYAVCLNTDKDHLDCYDGEDELRQVYLNFIKRAYKAIINKKDDFLASVNTKGSITFAVENGADYTAKNMLCKNGMYSFDVYKGDKLKGNVELSVCGYHNVENALAATVCATLMGIDFRFIKKGLKNFKGVVRRFERLGEINGADIIADYAHHPTEIDACLKTVKEIAKGKIYVVFQPHTYSRTVYLKEEFLTTLKQIENLTLFKTFSARESYQKGGSAYDLHLLIDKSLYFEDEEVLLSYYKKVLKKKDMLLVLGAGDLYDKIRKEFIKE